MLHHALVHIGVIAVVIVAVILLITSVLVVIDYVRHPDFYKD